METLNISLLEVIGAFALFFIILLAAGTVSGAVKWTFTVDDEPAK